MKTNEASLVSENISHLESCSILILCISLMLCHDKQKDKSYFGGRRVSSPSKRHIRQGGVGATSCSKTTSAAGRRREKKRIRLIKQTPLLFLSIDMKKYCSASSQEMLNKQIFSSSLKLTADSLYNTESDMFRKKKGFDYSLRLFW